MFDAHKGHVLSKIEEGARNVRGKINSSAKEGFFLLWFRIIEVLEDWKCVARYQAC